MDAIKIYNKLKGLEDMFRKREKEIREILRERFGTIGCGYVNTYLKCDKHRLFVVVYHDLFTATGVKNISKIMEEYGFELYEFNNDGNTINIVFVLKR